MEIFYFVNIILNFASLQRILYWKKVNRLNPVIGVAWKLRNEGAMIIELGGYNEVTLE